MLGTTLGHFRITAKLGEGGMGVVYRAEDGRLGREVAVKLLPEEFTADAERLARFEREARVLASLNHPNVAAIYEVGNADGRHFLAMELAAGESLAELIADGPIPLDTALEIALGIANGLEAAHERGIVHRDLKPGNVVVDRRTDAVKLLDFGLAKAAESASDEATDLTRSPTLTAQMTQAGVILGTAGYMSPEQARGKAVDRRTDIWAFGCILAEMLSAERTFGGRDVTETLADIIRGEPALEKLPATTPPALRGLIERCLQKEPRQRLRDIGDARLQLEEIRERPESITDPTSGARSHLTTWVAATLIALAGITAGMVLRPSAPEPAPVRSSAIDLPWDSVPNWTDFTAAISPTGEHVAYTGRVGNRVEAYIRSLDSLEARPVAPARESVSMAFSPDGNWLALLNGNHLSRIPVRGGEPVLIAELASAGEYGISWGPSGDLLLPGVDGVYQLPASGGDLHRVSHPADDAGYFPHRWPVHLPDGKRALIAVGNDSSSQVAILELETGNVIPLAIQGIPTAYASSGYLIVAQHGTVVAVPFDRAAGAPTGDAIRVLEDVRAGPFLADDGTALYLPERTESKARLVWVERNGLVTAIAEEARDYSHLDLSADGRSALLNMGDDIYGLDLLRGTRQLLHDAGSFPIYGNGEATLTYRGADGIQARLLDTGELEGLVPQPNPETAGTSRVDGPAGATIPTSWHPITGDLAFFDSRSDIWVRDPEGGLRRLLESPANERSGRFSPDGRWLAYVSDETGEFQVYVAPYPGSGRRIPVSIDGGLSPIWAADGSELFFRNGGALLAAPVRYEPEIEFGTPVQLFEGPFTLDLMGHQRYDVAPDGERFLMVENADDFRLVLVQSWLHELEPLAGTR